MSASPHAGEVRAAAAAWLERRHRDTWSPQDQVELDSWLAQSMSHRTAYWRVADAWNRADRLRVLGAPMQAGAKQASENRKSPQWLFRVATIAAVALVSAGGVAFSTYFTRPSLQTYSTTVGGRETLAFADGSEIDLNTNTVVRAAITPGHRQIWLDKGEAYFRIKHDAAHPFVVVAGGHQVTDLGTKFIVRRDRGRLEVSLVEGRAQVDAAIGSVRKAMLAPGDVLIATAETMSVSKKLPAVLSDRLGWRSGLVVFRHTTLADAAAEFNRYSDTHLVVADPSAARLTVVGTFRANDMKSFVEVAETIFKLKVERREGEIILSR